MSPPVQLDRWWTAAGGDVADRLFAYHDRIRSRLGSGWRERWVTFARLYSNERILALSPGSYTTRVDDASMRLNVVSAVVDTLLSKIGQSRPAPQFLTSGADYKLRRKAKKANKFGKGMLHQCGAYETAPMVLLDALVFGTGVFKVHSSDKKLDGERVFPWELLLDPVESWYGKPRTWLQRKFIERDVLLAKFGGDPRSASYKAIESATRADRDDLGRAVESDQILVLEAWRLPSSDGAKDGRHVIAIEGAALLDEKWKRCRAPFAVFHWRKPLVGFWGRGVAESLMPVQYEINTLLKKIQRAFALLGVPRVILDASSGVPEFHINNEIGAIIKCRTGAAPPTVIAPQTIHPEVFQHLGWLYQRSFEQEGISQMAAAAARPAGLDSGEALREYGDQTSERFVDSMRRWESFFMDIVRIGLDEVRAIGGVSVDVPDRNVKEDLSWSDIDLQDSAYVLQCFPMALLPQLPAARQQRIEEMTAAGWFGKEEAMELMDFPDLEDATSAATAPRTSIRQRIDRMLDGEYIAPEPFDVAAGPQSPAITMVLSAYLSERENGCPDDILQLLRDWLSACNALLQPEAAPPGMMADAQAQQQAAQGAPGPAPQGPQPMPMAA